MKPRAFNPVTTFVTVGHLAVWAVAPHAPAQNLVTNGGFDQNAASFSLWPGYLGGPNPTTISGWSSFTVDGGVGVNGTNTVNDLNAFGPTSSAPDFAFIQRNSGIGQTLTTLTPGNGYLLTFEGAGRQEFASSGLAVYANAGTNVPNLVLDGSVAGSWWLDRTAFRKYAFAFTAASSSQTIQFNAVGSGDYTSNIDNVSVTPVSSAIAINDGTTFFTGTSGTIAQGFNVTGNQVFFQRPGTVTYTGNINGTGNGTSDAWSIHSAGRLAGAANLIFSGSTIDLGNKALSIRGNMAENAGNVLSLADANNQMTTFHNVSLIMANSILVSRGALKFSGNSAVYTGGGMAQHGTGTDWAWGSLTIQDNASVYVTGGIEFNNAGANLAFNGGTLTTPSIWGADFSDYGGSRTIFNGTRIVASQSNSNFLKVSVNYDENATNGTAYVGSGGAIFDTNGFNITVAPPLADLPGNAGILKKIGSGSLLLTGANTYSGGTIIEGGYIMVNGGTNGGNLGSGPVTLNGGGFKNNDSTPSIDTLTTLGPSGGYFTAGWNKYVSLVGQITGTGALNVNTDGGSVYLYNSSNNYEGATNIGTTGPGYFDQTTTAKLYLANSNVLPDGTTVNLLTPASVLYLNGYSETIGGITGNGSVTLGGGSLNVGAGNISSIFGGSISGTGTLTKIGNGILSLNTSNIHTGTTSVNGGVLRLNHATALPGGIGASGGTSALTLSGGVIGLGAGNFNRALGTGVAQVQFISSGGFAAYGADRSVNLGGASAEVTWGSGGFVPNGSILVLGAPDASHQIDFQNPIQLAGELRVVQVNNGTAANDAILSGVLTGTGNSSLIKTGDGTLTLTGANDYKGTTTISGGKLVINGNQSGATGAINVKDGAVLGGSGTVGGATTIEAGGVHAPGNSPGIQTFVDDLTYDSNSIFEWELAGSALGVRGTGYDGVSVGGTLSGSNAIFRVILNTGSFADAFWNGSPEWLDIFKNGTNLLTMNGIFGTFQYWEGNTNVTSSVTANQGYFTINGSTLEWNAVPEPTGAVAALLLGAGLLRRRR